MSEIILGDKSEDTPNFFSICPSNKKSAIYLYTENVMPSEKKIMDAWNHRRKCSINSSKNSVVLFFSLLLDHPSPTAFPSLTCSWKTKPMCEITTRSCGKAENGKR